MSGPYAIAISGIFVVVLLLVPHLHVWFGTGGLLAIFVVLASGGIVHLSQSQFAKASHADDISTDEPEQRQQRGRKKKKKGRDRDARGLKFHDLKAEAHCTDSSDASQEKRKDDCVAPPTLQRTLSRDDEGNLWDFSEKLVSRSYSIKLDDDPIASTEDQGEHTSVDERVDEQLEPDLFALFSAAAMLEYLPAGRKWCVEEGASFIEEVIDNIDDLVSAIGLQDKHKTALKNASKSQVFAKSKSSLSNKLSSRQPSRTMSTTRQLTKTWSSVVRTVSMIRTLSRTASTASAGSVGKMTRTVSYLQSGTHCNEVHADMTETLEEDSDSDTDVETEDGEKTTPPRKKFATIAKGVLLGIKMGLASKRKREEFEAKQVSVTPSSLFEEETKLTGKSALEMLASFQGAMVCNCVTLIVPAGTPTLMSLAKQADGRRTRKYLNAIASQLPGQGDDIPKNGCGLFLKIYGGGTDELTVIEPPRPVRKFALSDGTVFATELLAQLFVDTAAAGCVVISGEEASIYKLFEDHAILEAKIQPRLQKRQKKGGQSALRIARLAEEVRAAYVRIVAERTNKEFMDEEGAPNVEMLAIGGSKELSDNLHDSAHLNYRLQKIMKRTAQIKETSSMVDVLRESLALRKHQSAANTTALLHEMEAQAHTSLAAYGVKDVSRRINESNLKKLLFANGCGLAIDDIKRAREIKSAKVEEVQKGTSAFDELSRKWGGAFALLCWEPGDDYDDDA